MRGRSADRYPALVASAALHAAVLAAALFTWTWNRQIHIGEVVPVTLVNAQALANAAPAIQAPTPAPATTQAPELNAAPLPPAPQEAPVPAPPPMTRTPPHPHADLHPQPVAKLAPTPTPKPAPKVASTPKFDPDAILASLEKASKAAGSTHSAAPRGPTRPQTAVEARLAPGTGSAASASALSNLGAELERLWNPNCEVEGAADVVIKVSFQLDGGGRVPMGTVTSSADNAVDPAVRAASDRAKRAVYQGAPFDGLPADLYGQRVSVNFNAKQFCASR
jgi:outer membrane biosynthesis protein TonB